MAAIRQRLGGEWPSVGDEWSNVAVTARPSSTYTMYTDFQMPRLNVACACRPLVVVLLYGAQYRRHNQHSTANKIQICMAQLSLAP